MATITQIGPGLRIASRCAARISDVASAAQMPQMYPGEWKQVSDGRIRVAYREPGCNTYSSK